MTTVSSRCGLVFYILFCDIRLLPLKPDKYQCNFAIEINVVVQPKKGVKERVDFRRLFFWGFILN